MARHRVRALRLSPVKHEEERRYRQGGEGMDERRQHLCRRNQTSRNIEYVGDETEDE